MTSGNASWGSDQKQYFKNITSDRQDPFLDLLHLTDHAIIHYRMLNRGTHTQRLELAILKREAR